MGNFSVVVNLFALFASISGRNFILFGVTSRPFIFIPNLNDCGIHHI